MRYKTGLKRSERAFSRLNLMNYVDTKKLFMPTGDFGHYGLVKNPWGMLGNDKYGNCVAEGTQVSSPNINAAFRSRYSGSMVTLSVASGKKLTVTPQHYLLTDRGFIPAQFIKNGDNLISACGSQILPWSSVNRSKSDFNKMPTPIEEIFLAFSLSLKTTRKIMPMSVDFHGDEKFFDSAVDVVGTNSFLRCQNYATLRKPNAQNKISAARELKRQFIRFCASLLPSTSGLLPAHCNIGFSGYRFPFFDSEVCISEAESLRHRTKNFSGFDDFFFKMPSRKIKFFRNITKCCTSNILTNGLGTIPITTFSGNAGTFGNSSKLIASPLKSSFKSRPTDPDFFSNLIEAFPGLVEKDHVINIDFQKASGVHVYDLSTEHGWYTANGLVVHNCAWAGAAHQEMIYNAAAGRQLQFTQAGVLSDYASTGFDPITGANDDGTDLDHLATYWQSTGIVDAVGARHKIEAWLDFDPIDPYQLTIAAYYFLSAGLGVHLYDDADDDFDTGKPWAYEVDGTDESFHYAPVVGRKGGFWIHSTWGGLEPSEPDFIAKRADQGLVFLSPEIFVNGKDIDGFGLNELQQDLAAFG